MKNKRVLLIPLAVLVIAAAVGVALTMNGQRLAAADGGNESNPDQLVGFLVTEGSWSAQEASIAGDGEAARAYAINLPEHETAGENDLSSQDRKVSFEGIDGAFFFYRSDGDVTALYAEGGVFDTGISYIEKDQKETKEIKGTLAVLPMEISDASYFFHPIYQDADGRIYAAPGHMGIQAPTAGDYASQTISETSTLSDSGKETSSGTSVTMNLQGTYPPVSVAILQMDKASTILSQQTYQPGNLPEKLETEEGTEYLILEETFVGSDGMQQVNRTIVNHGEEFFLSHYKPENSNWISSQETGLEW